jgi:hypothetical protein
MSNVLANSVGVIAVIVSFEVLRPKRYLLKTNQRIVIINQSPILRLFSRDLLIETIANYEPHKEYVVSINRID